MSKDNEQWKPQKSQPDRSKGTTNESIKGSGDAGGSNRERKGTAGDGTNSTGPRKK